MDRYLCTLIIWLMLVAPVFGSVQYKSGGAFADVAAVQHKASGAFTDATPMAYIGSSWYTLLNYSDNYDYHFFVGAGQSNASGYCSYLSESPVVAVNAIEIMPSNRALVSSVSDPVSQDFGVFDETTKTSFWPSFCARYFAATGKIPIILVLGAQSSALYSGGTESWLDSTYASAASIISSAIGVLNAAEYNYVFKGVIWYQGESDALGYRTEAQYTSDLNSLLNRFSSDFGDIHFWVCEIKTITDASFDDEINNAINGVTAYRADSTLINNKYSSAWDGIGFVWHLSAIEYEEFGRDLADTISGD